jgi:hypothetical protein
MRRRSHPRLAGGFLVLPDGTAEPISPELCLVCPELAQQARQAVPSAPAERRRPLHARSAPASVVVQPRSALRSPGPGSRQAAPRTPVVVDPPWPPRPRRRLAPAVLTASALLVVIATAAGAVAPAETVRQIVPLESAAAPAVDPPSTVPPERVLVVPPLCQQPYVFAKGLLEESGFAWQVRGPVRGYAANLVAAQQPPAGTVVVDTGAPVISVELRQNPGVAARGTPDDAAPYPPTALRQAQAGGWIGAAATILSLFRSRCLPPGAIPDPPAPR